MCFQTNRIDAGIGPSSCRQLLKCLIDIVGFIVDDVERSTFLLRDSKARGKTIDRDYTRGAKKVSAAHCHLSHCARTPDRDRLVGFNAAHLGGHISGWERV